ncbi:putative uncharacterized protein DDB_G0282133 [Chrysoperla carnea]|uniref:putative uncharacterized protein DDB_G0282133 n=1 Tax=Chrysoperla carnea TaxID=189513 RepID=UPI001D096306|nr:putative uncharacterized protein DDB_G0282133 [Chrysoperla carnea]
MTKLINILLQRNDCNIPWGFEIQERKNAQQSIVITRVLPNAVSAYNIHRGDFILQIQDQSVTKLSDNEINNLINKPAKELRLIILQNTKSTIMPSKNDLSTPTASIPIATCQHSEIILSKSLGNPPTKPPVVRFPRQSVENCAPSKKLTQEPNFNTPFYKPQMPTYKKSNQTDGNSNENKVHDKKLQPKKILREFIQNKDGTLNLTERVPISHNTNVRELERRKSFFESFNNENVPNLLSRKNSIKANTTTQTANISNSDSRVSKPKPESMHKIPDNVPSANDSNFDSRKNNSITNLLKSNAEMRNDMCNDSSVVNYSNLEENCASKTESLYKTPQNVSKSMSNLDSRKTNSVANLYSNTESKHDVLDENYLKLDFKEDNKETTYKIPEILSQSVPNFDSRINSSVSNHNSNTNSRQKMFESLSNKNIPDLDSSQNNSIAVFKPNAKSKSKCDVIMTECLSDDETNSVTAEMITNLTSEEDVSNDDDNDERKNVQNLPKENYPMPKNENRGTSSYINNSSNNEEKNYNLQNNQMASNQDESNHESKNMQSWENYTMLKNEVRRTSTLDDLQYFDAYNDVRRVSNQDDSQYFDAENNENTITVNQNSSQQFDEEVYDGKNNTPNYGKTNANTQTILYENNSQQSSKVNYDERNSEIRTLNPNNLHHSNSQNYGKPNNEIRRSSFENSSQHIPNNPQNFGTQNSNLHHSNSQNYGKPNNEIRRSSFENSSQHIPNNLQNFGTQNSNLHHSNSQNYGKPNNEIQRNSFENSSQHIPNNPQNFGTQNSNLHHSNSQNYGKPNNEIQRSSFENSSQHIPNNSQNFGTQNYDMPKSEKEPYLTQNDMRQLDRESYEKRTVDYVDNQNDEMKNFAKQETSIQNNIQQCDRGNNQIMTSMYGSEFSNNFLRTGLNAPKLPSIQENQCGNSYLYNVQQQNSFSCGCGRIGFLNLYES